MPDPAPRRRLLLSALTNWLAFAATLLVSFFLAPYLIGKVGDRTYAVWGFVESVLAYLTLFDLGIAACVVRFVARYHARGEQQEINRLASSCLALFLGLGGIVFLLGMALTPLFMPALLKSGLGTGEVAGFMLLMLANLALTLPLTVFPAVLDGLERFTAKSVVRVLFLAVRTAGMVALAEQNPSLIGLGIVYTITNLLEHAALAWLSFRSLPGLRLSRRLVDRATFRTVKGYGLDAFLAMVAGRVSVQSGVIVIGLCLDAPHVTWFLIALRLVEFAKALLRSATNTLTPAISSLEAKGDVGAIRGILLNGTRWVLYLILPVHVGLVVFGRPFLTIWLNSPDYAVWCYPALVILSATLSLALAQSVASRILYGMGRLRLFARVTLVEAGLNLVLSLSLVGVLGIEGVALAAAVPNLALCLFAIGYTCGLLEVPWRHYVARCWVKPLVAAAVPVLVWLALDVPIRGWLDLWAAGLAGLVPYAVVVLALEGKIGPLTRRALTLLRSVANRGVTRPAAATAES